MESVFQMPSVKEITCSHGENQFVLKHLSVKLKGVTGGRKGAGFVVVESEGSNN